MHSYLHHIGDFRSGTYSMTRLQRAIYRELLDLYYDKEKPLGPTEKAVCQEIGAHSDEEIEIVYWILSFKFEKTEAGFVHDVCERVIEEYRAKADVARENGKSGGRPRKPRGNPEKPSGLFQEPSGNPEQTGSKANHKPLTVNLKPREEEQQQASAAVVLPPGDGYSSPVAKRATAIAVFLRQRGVSGANSANPNIQGWADDARVSDELLDAALSKARSSLGSKPAGVNYLVPIIADLLNPIPPPRMQRAPTWTEQNAATIANLTGQNRHAQPDDRIIDV